MANSQSDTKQVAFNALTGKKPVSAAKFGCSIFHMEAQQKNEDGSALNQNQNQMACEDVPYSRPLFLTIYTVVIVGIVLSSFYVFSAIRFSSTNPSAWSSFPPLSNGDPRPTDQILNGSQSATVHVVLSPPQESQTVETKPIFDIPPRNKKMPPLKAFRLTKELVQKRVKNNIIVVTFGNYAFMDFILTWVKQLNDLGLSNYLVGAMDAKLLEALYWKGIPVFDMGSHMSTIDVGWGSPTFHKMGREKVILINSILPFGFELLMCDTDMVWLKNPLPYLARYPEADVLTSSDQVVPTVVDDSLEIWQEAGAAYNIGIFHWRPTESAKKLAKEWKELLLADEKIWDQNGFNDIVHRQLGPSVDEDSGLVYAYDGNLKLGILPSSIFCSGHTYFVQAMYQQLRLEPYAVHTTFQFAGTEGKRHRLREAMLFHDPPEYYNPPGGFLSFKPSIPKSLLLTGKHTIESHFTLVNYQIKQIRTALAIASLLNRTLVMPPLWCRVDRLWFPHPGVLEGSMTRQPFLCPLDHVFEVNVMLKELPVEEFGSGIDIREYSILDNPSLPSEVKKSWLDVQLCKVGTQDCNATNNTTVGGVLKFPKHSNEETFIKVFSSFKDVKVIQFSSMQDAFTGFMDKARLFCSFHLKKGKRDSENALNITRVYGAACWITLPVTYIMICTGMRNLDGSQFLLKLLQMIIHLGEEPFYWKWQSCQIHVLQCKTGFFIATIKNKVKMRTWVVFQLPLKHITRWAFQNLALLRPRRSPSSHSFSSQNYQNGNFSIVKRQKVPNFPCAPALLSRCCHCFCTDIQLFEEMPQRRLHLRDIHFELVVDYIKLSLKKPKIVTATVAHCAALKIGALAHLPISTSLLTVYSKAGDFTSSRDLFDEIHNRDVIAWNAIVAASLENNCYKTAIDFFEKMIKAQTGFDSTTLLLMVSASLHMKNFDQGRAIHCVSIKSGMLVDISLIMRGSLYNGDPEKSLYYYKRMIFSEEIADHVSLSCAISACSSLGELAFGQSLHGQGIKLGYEDSSHVSVSNSLISLYSQCEEVEAAKTVFRAIAYKDIVSWNAMMEGFASNEKINKVFDLLIEMQATVSFEPDIVTLTTILPLCAELMLSREGRTIHGFAIRRQMVSDHLALLNSLIDMYSKCNLVEKAQLLFNSTTERDLVSWNAMISGYSHNKYTEEAQNLFRELLRWGLNCSSSTVFCHSFFLQLL
ncbi:Tetratricopeptide-like helical domain superfamily [Sesbania bispinosa]|nr:Tetratricopeptide-like helical domain superfamily [Sesbania bispinosa]